MEKTAQSNDDNAAAKNVPDKSHHARKKGKFQKYVIPFLVILFIAGGAAGIWYYEDQQKYVYTDNASIVVPLIQLTPSLPGILKEVMVHDGETVFAHETVARVGDEMISAQISGVVLTAKQDIGAVYSQGTPVVSMMDPKEMRVIASIQEDKGIKDIRVLDKVYFTVDAYGSQKFEGFVEEISNTSRQGDVVFNISDKRQEQDFNVKIRFDLEHNPPFQNGMSAKVWIVK